MISLFILTKHLVLLLEFGPLIAAFFFFFFNWSFNQLTWGEVSLGWVVDSWSFSFCGLCLVIGLCLFWLLGQGFLGWPFCYAVGVHLFSTSQLFFERQ